MKVTDAIGHPAAQTLVGAGAAASPDCIGTLRLNQADQTVNGHATVAGTVGALSVTQADQALNGHAGPILTGALTSRTTSTLTPRATLRRAASST